MDNYERAIETIFAIELDVLEAALQFYAKSPDGQYDQIAYDCIKAVILLRKG